MLMTKSVACDVTRPLTSIYIERSRDHKVISRRLKVEVDILYKGLTFRKHLDEYVVVSWLSQRQILKKMERLILVRERRRKKICLQGFPIGVDTLRSRDNIGAEHAKNRFPSTQLIFKCTFLRQISFYP